MEQHIRFCAGRDGARLAYATHGRGPVIAAAAAIRSPADRRRQSGKCRAPPVGFSVFRIITRLPPVDLRPPLVTMTARPAAALPDEQHSGRWVFEPKRDGWLNRTSAPTFATMTTQTLRRG